MAASALFPVLDRSAGAETRLVAALDLGASKTACLIGRVAADGALSMVGVGLAKPQTGPDGTPLDFDACVRAVRIAADQAERMAGCTITGVAVSYGGPGIKSQRVSAALALAEGVVTPKAVRAAIAAAVRTGQAPGRAVLHAIPAGYRLDDGALIADPRGKTANRISAELTLVTAPEAAVEALVDCVAEAGLRVVRVVASPYAAGLAVLSPEEREIGAIALDFGASRLGVAAFAGGGLVLADGIAAGGAGLTGDIARRLATTFAAAERIKIQHGGYLGHASDLIDAARLGPDGRLEACQIAPALVSEAMGPRIEDMLANLRVKLDALGRWEKDKKWRVALAGGGAHLGNLRDLAQALLSRPARMARPVGFGSLDEAPAGAAFAVAAGLIRYQVERPPEAIGEAPPADERPKPKRLPPAFMAKRVGGAVGKAWGWLKENF